MEFDLSDPTLLFRQDVLDDPRPLYDELRRRAPVWRLPGQDTYLVSDPKLVRDVVARTQEFSSNLVSLLHRGEDGHPVPFTMAAYGDPIHTIATADPPVHTRHRRLVQPALTPVAVADLGPAIVRIVDEHLSPLLGAGCGDVVAAFANPVPARVICAVVGLPSGDAPRLVELVLATGALLDGVTDRNGMTAAANAALELSSYAQTQLEAARAHPAGERSGLLAALTAAIESGQVSDHEVRDMLVVLISAGSETTSSLIATTVETLARDEGLQQRLRDDPSSIPDAIEAALRDDGPFQFHYRWTTTDATVGDTHIPAHSRVLVMWAAANRPSPGRFAAPALGGGGRTLPPHYAFGRGLHFCIGAHLARLEARLALEQLLARTSSFSLGAGVPTRRESIFLRRHSCLPVVLEPA